MLHQFDSSAIAHQQQLSQQYFQQQQQQQQQTSPTILPSQPLPPSSPLHRTLEHHPHLVHHQRGVFELQHAYQHHHQALIQQQQQAMDQHEQHTNASERGRKGTAEEGYHRKRSLTTAWTTAASKRSRRTGSNGDQDMDTDDAHHSQPSLQLEQEASKPNPSTLDYSEMILPRETLLATVPRTYSHRVYAGHGVYHHNSNSNSNHGNGHSSNSGTLYYNHANISSHPHHHFSLRSRHHHHHHHLHYNPFLNRKFPPYKYWAISAQRDYHLSRIGILVGRPGTSSSSSFSTPGGPAASSSSSSAPSIATAASSGGGPPPGAGGDLMLRTALGSAGGGVTKTHYRSRLPVHLRHMTSRTNRRPAICGNPFQDASHAQQGPSSVGRSNEGSLAMASASTAGSGAGASTVAGGGGSEVGQRRRLSDWKRVTALNMDLEDDQRGGMVMRLASQDRVTPVGNSSRHWMNHRGGLANLMQSSNAHAGSSSATGNTGRDTATSTVDRLVEEMNKWSV
ncbi:unnamed protein product [Mortierella alpina]